MNRQLLREYRRQRAMCHQWIVREFARIALRDARTNLLWDKLEDAGLVKLEAIPDDCEYDPGDLTGMSEGSIQRMWDRINMDGVWGVVGSYRLPDGPWCTGDSIWGCAGHANPCDDTDNAYVNDIRHETIAALRNALRSRCSACRK